MCEGVCSMACLLQPNINPLIHQRPRSKQKSWTSPIIPLMTIAGDLIDMSRVRHGLLPLLVCWWSRLADVEFYRCGVVICKCFWSCSWCPAVRPMNRDTWSGLFLCFWSRSWCSAVRQMSRGTWSGLLLCFWSCSWCSSRELWHLKWAIVMFLIVFLVFSRSPSESWHLTQAFLW